MFSSSSGRVSEFISSSRPRSFLSLYFMIDLASSSMSTVSFSSVRSTLPSPVSYTHLTLPTKA